MKTPIPSPAAIFAAAALLGSAALGSAAIYQVDGTVTSSMFGSLPAGTPFTITFTYQPSAAGGDLNADPTVGYYTNAVADGTITYDGTTHTLDLSGVIVTDQSAVTGSGDSLAPQIGTFPSIDGYVYQYGEFRFSGGETRWASDALPAEDLTSPWQSGSLTLTFEAPDSFGDTVTVEGALDMSSLKAVPEPSVALLAGAAGLLVLLRRQR